MFAAANTEIAMTSRSVLIVEIFMCPDGGFNPPFAVSPNVRGYGSRHYQSYRGADTHRAPQVGGLRNPCSPKDDVPPGIKIHCEHVI